MGEYSSFLNNPGNNVTTKNLVDLLQQRRMPGIQAQAQQETNAAESGNKIKEAAAESGNKINQDAAAENLKALITKNTQSSNMQQAQDYVDQNATKGRKVGVSLTGNGGVSLTQNEPNPLLQMGNKQAQEGQAFNKIAQKAYQPINDQLNASKSTLDALDQGNAVSDKLALVNEARLVAGAGGSRAIKSIMDVLTGGKTANSSFQETLNYIQNTPNIPTMQPAQRDAIRESVYNRFDQLQNMHQQARTQLQALGPSVAPMMDTSPIVNAYASPVEANFQNLSKMKDTYYAARKGQQGAAVSSPSVASANPTTVDRLKSMFGLGGSPQPQPQQQAPTAAPGGNAPSSDPIADEIAKRPHLKGLVN